MQHRKYPTGKGTIAYDSHKVERQKVTHHKVPSTSNTIPFKRGAVDVPVEPRGANFRGRRYLQAVADMMERAAFILNMNRERERLKRWIWPSGAAGSISIAV